MKSRLAVGLAFAILWGGTMVAYRFFFGNEGSLGYLTILILAPLIGLGFSLTLSMLLNKPKQ